MTTPLYIFDLDGTLADLKHRRHHVERPANCKCDNWSKYNCLDHSEKSWKPNWDAFHTECVNDTPIRPVIAVLQALQYGENEVWIWSGRNDSVLAETRQWLWNHIGLDGITLQMRSANDRRMDEVIKEEWLHAMSPEDRARLVMIFDDRQRVVDMWRRNGVVCAQVAPGDF